jgi:hypothetical protein
VSWLVHSQDEVADVNFVRIFYDKRTRDLSAVDVRAVGALEIDNDELSIFENDPSMSLGDIALRQDNIVALNTPNCDLCFVEVQAALVPALLS